MTQGARARNSFQDETPLLRAALNSKAAELAAVFLGEPNRQLSSKRELRFGRKGSLALVVDGPKAGLWRDHETGTGGDLFDLIERERGGGFPEAAHFAREFVGGHLSVSRPTPATTATNDDDTERRRALALSIFKESRDIRGTAAARYLERRGLVLPEGAAGRAIRFHGGRPCMVALLRDILTNEPRAIHRTALTEAGEKIGRKVLGPKAGAAVKLSPDETVSAGLAIGEGIETTIAGNMLDFSPAWAVGDAGELARFPVLSGIECLTLFVDHDMSGTGQARALECSARWTAAGREVQRVIPRQPGADIANVIEGAAHA